MSIDNVQLTVRIPEITFHIQQAIRKYQGDLDAIVADGVEKALRSFNFDAVVSNEINGQLREAIKTTIKSAIYHLIWEPEFTEKVQAAMRESIRAREKEQPR